MSMGPHQFGHWLQTRGLTFVDWDYRKWGSCTWMRFRDAAGALITYRKK